MHPLLDGPHPLKNHLPHLLTFIHTESYEVALRASALGSPKELPLTPNLAPSSRWTLCTCMTPHLILHSPQDKISPCPQILPYPLLLQSSLQ